MKRQVLITFMVAILSLVVGAASYPNYPFFIIDWTVAGVVLTGSVLNWIYQWRKRRKALKK